MRLITLAALQFLVGLGMASPQVRIVTEVTPRQLADEARAKEKILSILRAYDGPGNVGLTHEAEQELCVIDKQLDYALNVRLGRIRAMLSSEFNLITMDIRPSRVMVADPAPYSAESLRPSVERLLTKFAPKGRRVEMRETEERNGTAIYYATYRYDTNPDARYWTFRAATVDLSTGELLGLNLHDATVRIDPRQALHRIPISELTRTAIALYVSQNPHREATIDANLRLMLPGGGLEKMLNELTTDHQKAYDDRVMLPILEVVFCPTKQTSGELQRVYVDGRTGHPIGITPVTGWLQDSERKADSPTDYTGLWTTSSGSAVTLKRLSGAWAVKGPYEHRRLYSATHTGKFAFSRDLSYAYPPGGGVYVATWKLNALTPLRDYAGFGQRASRSRNAAQPLKG